MVIKMGISDSINVNKAIMCISIGCVGISIGFLSILLCLAFITWLTFHHLV